MSTNVPIITLLHRTQGLLACSTRPQILFSAMPLPLVALGAVSSITGLVTGMREAVRTCTGNKASCCELISRCERLVQALLHNPRWKVAVSSTTTSSITSTTTTVTTSTLILASSLGSTHDTRGSSHPYETCFHTPTKNK